MTQAIVLCSGGIDSVVTANYVKKKLKYDNLIVLFFNYGQKTLRQEREYSRKCAENLNGEFLEINLEWLGDISNSLINKTGEIKKIEKKDLKDTKEESEKYYVPCRNSVFLVYAIALAESIFVKKKIKSDIFVGFKCEGKESYPDTTKEFVEQINKLSNIGCSGKFNILAPLIEKDKEDIVKLGQEFGVKLEETYSCYVGAKNSVNNNGINDNHCGKCLACALRKQGFYWANIEDKTKYEE